MAINYQEIVAELDRVLAQVEETEILERRRVCLFSPVAQLVQSANVQRQAAKNGAALAELCMNARYAQQDLFNVLNLLNRISWMRARVSDGTMTASLFEQFATADIDMFHVEFRSIFDYLARGMAPFAAQELPDSFNKLRERLRERQDYGKAIGERLAGLVTSCTWFGYLKDSRDDLIHEGDVTLVFPHEERLLFQTFGPTRIRINFPPVMFNENIVDFELYAGMWLGRLYDYLGQWAREMSHISGITPTGHPLLCSDGVAIGVEWIKKARAAFFEFHGG